MTTAADMIVLALKDIGVLDESETPSAATTADALTTLNQMLAMWQADGMYVYAETTASLTPTGATSYTVGSGMDLNITRPQKLEYVYWTDGGTDYPVQILDTYEEYLSIAVKAITGIPAYAYYLPSYPTGQLFLFPEPDSGTVKVTTLVQLPTFTTSADALTLPPEYEMAIRYNLAEHLSVAMSVALRPDVAAMAARTRRVMKRNNLKIVPMETGYAGYYDINSNQVL
ncbi:MAG: phage adaptor protein [Burkholderiales bacterium]